MKNSGIYTITNLLDRKIYLGYTNNLLRRPEEHFSDLRRNSHPNEYLQNAFNKYGEENFLWEELVTCDEEDLCSQEHYWATILNVHNKNYGYNIKPTHPHSINQRSKETSEKIAKTKRINAEERGYWFSRESIEKRKITRKGYKHTEETKAKIGIKSLNRTHIVSNETKIKMSKIAKDKNFSGIKKSVIQYSKEGEFIKEWNSITEASKSGFSISAIVEVCKNKPHRKTHKKYVWKYKEM